MLYGWLDEERFILNSYHHHILPKRKYFLMKKGQLPPCNIVEKTVSNVWEWFTDNCNNYIKWFWLITRQIYMTSKLISEGLLYELVSNTAFLVCQKYRLFTSFMEHLCNTDAPSSFQRNFPERLGKTPIWLLACTIHCMNGFIHFTWKMLQTIFQHRIMLRWET